MDIKRRVNNLVRKYNTRNPFRLAKELSIYIVYKELGNIKGYYRNILGNKFIVINSSLDEFSQLIICAHELGHCTLHTNKGVKFMRENTFLYNANVIETQANMFAAELLINDDIEYNQYSIEHSELDFSTLQKLYNLKFNIK